MRHNYPLPTYEFERPYPRPQIRVVSNDQSPSQEMRKWLLEGHKKRLENQNKNIVF